MTIGFSLRYRSTSSCSFPPSLLTTSRYSDDSTVTSRCGGRAA